MTQSRNIAMKKILEHCDERAWSIVMTRAMEHCDDTVMEHCDDKNSGALC